MRKALMVVLCLGMIVVMGGCKTEPAPDNNSGTTTGTVAEAAVSIDTSDARTKTKTYYKDAKKIVSFWINSSGYVQNDQNYIYHAFSGNNRKLLTVNLFIKRFEFIKADNNHLIAKEYNNGTIWYFKYDTYEVIPPATDLVNECMTIGTLNRNDILMQDIAYACNTPYEIGTIYILSSNKKIYFSDVWYWHNKSYQEISFNYESDLDTSSRLTASKSVVFVSGQDRFYSYWYDFWFWQNEKPAFVPWKGQNKWLSAKYPIGSQIFINKSSIKAIYRYENRTDQQEKDILSQYNINNNDSKDYLAGHPGVCHPQTIDSANSFRSDDDKAPVDVMFDGTYKGTTGKYYGKLTWYIENGELDVVWYFVPNLEYPTNFTEDVEKKATWSSDITYDSEFIQYKYAGWLYTDLPYGFYASPVFDPIYYYCMQKDVRECEAYKTPSRYQGMRNHFIGFGIKEGRVASEVFNVGFYKNKYSDVAGLNNYKAFQHFITTGIPEGRQGSANFDVKTYLDRYPGIKAICGTDYRRAILHYFIYKYSENLSGNPTPPSIVLYYPFDGNLNDYGNYKINATGADISYTTDRFGEANSAVHFNETSYLNCGNDPFLIMNDQISISLWVRADSLGTRIAGRYDNILKGGWRLYVNSSGQIVFGISDGNTDRDITTLTTITPGSYYHIVCTYSAVSGKIKIYINGSLDVEQTYTAGRFNYENIDNPECINMEIGGFYAYGHSTFKGDIDDFRMYNYEIDQAMVLTLYSENNGNNDLVAYYPLNGNANDSSINGLNGVLSNQTLTADRFNAANKAYHFSGNGYINCGNSSLFVMDKEISVSFWARFNNNNSRIMGKYDNNLKGGWRVSINAAGKIAFGISDGNSDHEVISASVVSLNDKYHHIVCTYNKTLGIVRIYIDNAIAAEETGFYSGVFSYTPSQWPNCLNFEIGSFWAYGESHFTGDLDDIRLYNKAIDTVKINELYHENGYGY